MSEKQTSWTHSRWVGNKGVIHVFGARTSVETFTKELIHLQSKEQFPEQLQNRAGKHRGSSIPNHQCACPCNYRLSILLAMLSTHFSGSLLALRGTTLGLS
mmetsp:Transcript_3052/g.4351  ORF Transcript_3052/g.4351 Transcript_3052/m.4351 type:complete len:101 (-) Transcript_3052:2438-2740(-)